MTHLPIPIKRSRMGRPPLSKDKKEKTVTTVIRLTDDVRNRIEVIAGKKRMAEFIRQAIEAELERRENSAGS